MPETSVHEFRMGSLRITVGHSRIAGDEGPTVRVYGTVAGRERLVLRFDCLQDDPQYHYDPQGADELHHMRDEGIESPLEWTLHRLERNLPEMIRRAGYGELADQVDPSQVAEHLPAIREALWVPVG